MTWFEPLGPAGPEAPASGFLSPGTARFPALPKQVRVSLSVLPRTPVPGSCWCTCCPRAFATWSFSCPRVGVLAPAASRRHAWILILNPPHSHPPS